MPRKYFLGLIFIMVVVSSFVMCFNVDRTYVILIAQVFNGCLLPLFATCLMLCLNDKEFMSTSPQSGVANIAMSICVTLTFVFTSNVLLQKLFGSFLTNVYLRLGLAFGLGSAGMLVVSLVTGLAGNIIASLRK